MKTPTLLHHLPLYAAERTPDAIALGIGEREMDYGTLARQIEHAAAGLAALGLQRGERLGLWLDKRPETVVAAFAAAAAGLILVPINPILKPEQVGHILRDCNVRLLLSNAARVATLHEERSRCPDLLHVLTIDPPAGESLPQPSWQDLLAAGADSGWQPPRLIDDDPVAILYTSGSTGLPKGVVLSHRNMVAGALSVASYLDNRADDVLLAALPLSFDAGFSQLTTAFAVGARVQLLNYLMPRDVIKALARYRITGLTAVAPLWVQLAQLDWPAGIDQHLRYFANTGGRMPRAILARLRERLPASKPYLMYGLTEAFRATYLPPEEVDRRPDSIGKAIPNAEILVLRPDGSPCAADEPGELVQRGALVAQGYWNDAERSAERFRPLPAAAGVRPTGLLRPEIVVFSGDTVRRDADGFLYFIGRKDEMIKTSGYRVSPTEVEEVLYASGLVGDVAAVGQPDEALGEAIVVFVTPASGQPSVDDDALRDALRQHCRAHLPPYMLPTRFEVRSAPLPRNPNGKIDRKLLARELSASSQDSTQQ